MTPAEAARRGFVQVYTGDGKGKTTCALGLVLRAAGAGWPVYFAQFMKADPYSEIRVLRERFPEVEVEQFGAGGWLHGGQPSEEHKAHAAAGVVAVRERVASGRHRLVVADELALTPFFGLATRAELESVLDARAPGVELVLTGRRAPDWLLARADLVTEMREVKHYFHAGVPARVGIEM